MDSGAGGLSILRSIHQALPHADLLYVADQAYAPYGDLTPSTIQQRLVAIGQFFMAQGCQMMVVACNTATVAGIQYLREHLTIPVVGVEPAVKPACSVSQRKRVTVLATPTTAQSARLIDLIDTWRADSEVAIVASACLASLIDQMPMSEASLEQEVQAICAGVLAHESDALVLACTHYPLIVEAFVRRLPGVNIVEPSKGVTAQVLRLLQAQGEPCLSADRLGSLSLLSTGSKEAQVALAYWADGLAKEVESISV
nr:glutamate racemase [Marinomonas ostreistagni]